MNRRRGGPGCWRSRVPRPRGDEPRTGAAWRKKSNEGRECLGLKREDPGCKAPISADLVDDEDGEGASLIRSRPDTRRGV